MNIFTQEEADIIGEIANICVGSSATSLNMMLNQPVTLTTPEVIIVQPHEVLSEYASTCVIVKVKYKEGLRGSNFLVLKDEDAKIITDLMLKGNGKGDYTIGDLTDMHLSAIAEAMNQMTASAATAMSKLLDHKIEISPPVAQSIVVNNYDITQDFDDSQFVKIIFRMKIGNLIDSTIMQLYPFDLAHSIYQLFQRRK